MSLHVFKGCETKELYHRVVTLLEDFLAVENFCGTVALTLPL